MRKEVEQQFNELYKAEGILESWKNDDIHVTLEDLNFATDKAISCMKLTMMEVKNQNKLMREIYNNSSKEPVGLTEDEVQNLMYLLKKAGKEVDYGNGYLCCWDDCMEDCLNIDIQHLKSNSIKELENNKSTANKIIKELKEWGFNAKISVPNYGKADEEIKGDIICLDNAIDIVKENLLGKESIEKNNDNKEVDEDISDDFGDR